jgi:hypothetical protein
MSRWKFAVEGHEIAIRKRKGWVESCHYRDPGDVGLLHGDEAARPPPPRLCLEELLGYPLGWTDFNYRHCAPSTPLLLECHILLLKLRGVCRQRQVHNRYRKDYEKVESVGDACNGRGMGQGRRARFCELLGLCRGTGAQGRYQGKGNTAAYLVVSHPINLSYLHLLY